MPVQSTRKQIKKLAEQDPLLKSLLADSENAHDLKVLFESDGGKLLVSALLQDIINAVDKIAGSYQTATHQELMSYAATLSTNLNLIRSLGRASENEAAIEEMIKEHLAE